jgi:hypothetical protein
MMIALAMKKFLIVISTSPFLSLKTIPPINELEVCVAVKCELPTPKEAKGSLIQLPNIVHQGKSNGRST